MAVIGSILHGTVRLSKTFRDKRKSDAYALQHKTLSRLVFSARQTAFGKAFGFSSILKQKNRIDAFRKQVPVYDYSSLYEAWWHRTVNDEPDVCCPGRPRYFALSSGTSESTSKRIPVTNDMIRAVRKTSTRQIISLAQYDLPATFFRKEILMLGGSTQLKQNGLHYEGDLSGILATRIPFWFKPFYKPGKTLAKEVDWSEKLDRIAQEAINWDIGIICGVPAWVQMLMEKIIAYHKVKHIHEVWPSLRFFVHGGVAFAPYENEFNKLLGEPIHYLETYLASEGFLAFQNRKERGPQQLVLDSGIFFEFVPFNEYNFDENGKLYQHAVSYTIDQVKEGIDYALLISTCAGAWRYLIGDTVRFTNVQQHEIIITGRTKHFLSLCGEHLSVDNMNQALTAIANTHNLHIKEFTVLGVPYDSLFAHEWYIGCDNANLSSEEFAQLLDEQLKSLNDDYKTERTAALKAIFVHLLPTSVFLDWMEEKGKLGGQHKFPRVLKGDLQKDWKDFVKKRNVG